MMAKSDAKGVSGTAVSGDGQPDETILVASLLEVAAEHLCHDSQSIDQAASTFQSNDGPEALGLIVACASPPR